MYYNIKIKVLDSEYSLESENRGIIEREMDAYFAYFFDVSYEFKSQIKQVELTKDSLVSIDKIENPEPSYKEEEVQYYESSDNFDEPPVDEQQPPIEQVFEQEQPVEEAPEEAVEEVAEEVAEEVVEEVAEEAAEEAAEDKQDVFIPDIVVDEPEPEVEVQVQQTPVLEENLYQEPPKVEIFKQPKPAQEPTKPPTVKLEFKFFLAGFIISDIFNQFMACAYYIKNVLKENYFNMKGINSHLIKATGNIADMSVVSQLIQREYIESKEINDSTVYFITPLGEEYFIKKYQE